MGVVYLAALGVGGLVFSACCPGESTLWRMAVADLAATALVFAASRAFDNSSVYDPFWSVAPVASGAALASSSLRSGLVLAALAIYGVRLTANWVRGWAGLHHEDWRYADFRTRYPRAYWLISAFGIHLFPTLQVFLGCLPLFFALPSSAPFGVLDGVAVFVILASTAVEGVADEQLRRYRLAGGVGACTVGLWQLSRHPNYLGEIGVWFGVWLAGVAVGAPWWTAAGWVAIFVMFVGVSIPMAERRALQRRPEYADIQRRIPMLFPNPFRR